jgi:hypothetical protein
VVLRGEELSTSSPPEPLRDEGSRLEDDSSSRDREGDPETEAGVDAAPGSEPVADGEVEADAAPPREADADAPTEADLEGLAEADADEPAELDPESPSAVGAGAEAEGQVDNGAGVGVDRGAVPEAGVLEVPLAGAESAGLPPGAWARLRSSGFGAPCPTAATRATGAREAGAA